MRDKAISKSPTQMSLGFVATIAITSLFNVKSAYAASQLKSISVGRSNWCTLSDEGMVSCQGNENYRSTYQDKLVPPVTRLNVGVGHVCAIDAEGVKRWYKMSDSLANDYPQPEFTNPTEVSCGSYHACVLDAGEVKCWGNNRWGQTDVPQLFAPSKVGAGEMHSCALDAHGVTCWGGNNIGQLDVPSLRNPRELAVGPYENCVLDDEGIKCWGEIGGGVSRVPLSQLRYPYGLSVGGGQFCVMDDGKPRCWGRNDYHQSAVPELLNPVAVSAGTFATCAIHGNNQVTCWGVFN